MENYRKIYDRKRGRILVNNLKKRHCDAYYFDTKEEALEKALQLIPEDALVGWGGATSAEQIGLLPALRSGARKVIDRDTAQTPEQRREMMRKCLLTDVFITGCNGLSLTGEMVNIDGMGNRVAAIVYGPEKILVIAGMNKVTDTLEEAVSRARTVAAPVNKQRFGGETPCMVTGSCGNCLSEGCICNQILITRNCRPAGRITFLLVGENLGF